MTKGEVAMKVFDRFRRARRTPVVKELGDASFGIQSVVKEELTNVKEVKKDRKDKADEHLIKCPKCGKMVNRARVVKLKYVCYECNAYFRV